jgi:hypothetical protein
MREEIDALCKRAGTRTKLASSQTTTTGKAGKSRSASIDLLVTRGGGVLAPFIILVMNIT